jgi:hypothetical protein
MLRTLFKNHVLIYIAISLFFSCSTNDVIINKIVKFEGYYTWTDIFTEQDQSIIRLLLRFELNVKIKDTDSIYAIFEVEKDRLKVKNISNTYLEGSPYLRGYSGGIKDSSILFIPYFSPLFIDAPSSMPLGYDSDSLIVYDVVMDMRNNELSNPTIIMGRKEKGKPIIYK